MKSLIGIILIAGAIVVGGCAESKREAEKAKSDADAKARADAAKKEMDTLPKVFSTPDYYKKNEPAKAPAASPAKSETTKN